MYFIPKHGAFYAYVATVKPIYRYFSTFAIALVIVLLWFFGVYSRLETSIIWYANQVNQIRDQKNRMLELKETRKKLKATILRLQDQFNLHRTDDASGNDFATTCLFIFDKLRDCKLELGSCTVHDQKKEAWRSQNDISLDFKGPFDQVTQFFNQLGSKNKKIVCKDISITSVEDDIFSVKIVLEIYTVS